MGWVGDMKKEEMKAGRESREELFKLCRMEVGICRFSHSSEVPPSDVR